MKLLIPIDVEQTRPPETDGLFTYDEHTVLIRAQHFHRPQRSCGKVMFSQVCVKNSFQGGGLSQHELGHTSPGQTLPPSACWDTSPCLVHAGIHTLLPSACWGTHPPTQCMLGYTPSFLVHPGIHPLQRPLQRMVHILLECILVDAMLLPQMNGYYSLQCVKNIGYYYVLSHRKFTLDEAPGEGDLLINTRSNRVEVAVIQIFTHN